MALATQCPHCNTTFRVAHDQLKLRAGLVRCGTCKEVFNGIEHLLRQEGEELPGASPARPGNAAAHGPAADTGHDRSVVSPPPDSVAAPAEHNDFGERGDTWSADQGDSPPPVLPAENGSVFASTDPDADPLQRMTLMDLAEDGATASAGNSTAASAAADQPDLVEKAIEELQNKPERKARKPHRGNRDLDDPEESAAVDEPSFVTQGNRRRRFGRALQMLAAAGSAVLLLALLAQSVFVFRNQLAAWFPSAKPLLAEGCVLLGCQVGLPAQIDMISLESSDLQVLEQTRNVYALNALLRNQSATAQAWPNIELTLNDTNEMPLARKVFLPRDYLSATQDSTKGFEAKSERAVKLYFEISSLQAAGYRIYLFYP